VNIIRESWKSLTLRGAITKTTVYQPPPDRRRRRRPDNVNNKKMIIIIITHIGALKAFRGL